VYGVENTGTTRFGCTVPCADGAIGWLAIDKNSKVTLDKYREELGLPIVVNQEPIISYKQSIQLATLEDVQKVIAIYTEVMKRTIERLVMLAESPGIESVVIDRASQLYDMIMFSHFGRKNQIESYQRGAPNQDMIDIINALSNKNLVLVHKAADIWKDTGEVDKQGRKKQAPTGKMKPDGFNQVGRFVTAVVELTSKSGKCMGESDGEMLADKYRLKVVSCKGNVLLEGQDIGHEDLGGVCGEAIGWYQLLAAIGVGG
jgi:hypothetical protein